MTLAGSRCGSPTSPRGSGSGSPSTTRSAGASRPSPSATTLLATGLRARLADIPGVTVRDRGERLCAITSFTVDGVDPEDVKARLRGEGCNVSVSTATSAQLDLGHRGLDSVVRASLHYLTTDDELDRFATLLHEICGR